MASLKRKLERSRDKDFTSKKNKLERKLTRMPNRDNPAPSKSSLKKSVKRTGNLIEVDFSQKEWKRKLKSTTFTGKDNFEETGYIIDTPEALTKFAKLLMRQEYIFFDCEFTNLMVQAEGKADIVGMSFSWGDDDDHYYLPIGHIEDDEPQLEMYDVVNALKPIWEDESKWFVGHNIKVDVHIVENYGLKLHSRKWIDTLVCVWLYNENWDKGLKSVTERVYDVTPIQYNSLVATVPKEVKKEHGLKANSKATIDLTLIEHCAPYAIADAYWCNRHWNDWLRQGLEAEEMSDMYFKRLMPFLIVTYNMERRGSYIDKTKVEAMAVEAQKILDKLEYEIISIAGVHFGVGSDQQVAELLCGYKKYKEDKKTGEMVYCGNRDLVAVNFGFPVLKKSDKTGQPSMAKDILVELTRQAYPNNPRKIEGQEMIRKILQYRKVAKLRSTYMIGLMEQIYPDGKVHPKYNVGGTDSGRLSSSEPNFQNLPRPVELEAISMPKFLKNGADVSELNDILRCFTIEHDELGVIKDIKLKKILKIGSKALIDKFDWKEFRKALHSWRIDNWFAILLKGLEIRAIVVPESSDYVTIAHDYSNLEMRLLAHFSGDENLVRAFRDDADSHGATAVNMFALDCDPNDAKKYYKALRQIAKTINFLLMYGGSAMTLFTTLLDEQAKDEDGNLITKAKAKEYYDLYFDTYLGVRQFIANQKKFAHKHGVVYTIAGRKRRLENINTGSFKIVAYEERLSVNSPIQGSAGDIMIAVQPVIDNDPVLKELGYIMFMQVHDEIVGIAPKENAEACALRIKELMEHPFRRELNIPLRVDYDIGWSYADAK